MKRSEISPDDLMSAIAMREAGYTLLSISQRYRVSVRSLQRKFALHGAKKGAVKRELVERARAEMLQSLSMSESFKLEMAKAMEDDFAHVRNIRQIMAEASELMQARTLTDTVMVMRGAAAYSTAIKNTSEVLRNIARDVSTANSLDAGFPELIVKELTAEEVEAMRATAVEV